MSRSDMRALPVHINRTSFHVSYFDKIVAPTWLGMAGGVQYQKAGGSWIIECR